ncbi:hypothetical protein [Anaerobium acetethylicum]|uniref:Uncharacterized protein n=1 Tax=Anaerobium acetethylicum TaxID=1619234 RepID=A0A1D3TVU2_9FIRM|nr:hypothetical protein [Anaerobium acetethylicum]SCP98312.1 hypothetical protein SAMN05421730_101921 [Anaerobium acetethylicum]
MGSSQQRGFTLCMIKCHKEIKNATVAGNLAANLFLNNAMVGQVNDNFVLSLTNEKLYIDVYNYCTYGGLAELLYTEEFDRDAIRSFEVRSEGEKEYIDLTIQKKHKEDKRHLFRYNKEGDNLAMEMKELLELKV